jgi:hypothetical protein
VPVFLLALLVARRLPAILYRPRVGGRGSIAAGLLQATSLPFIVAATAIGMELGLLSPLPEPPWSWSACFRWCCSRSAPCRLCGVLENRPRSGTEDGPDREPDPT